MRRLLSVLALVTLAGVVMVRFQGPAAVALWILLVTASAVVMGWRRWPRPPPSAPSLTAPPPPGRRRAPQSVAALELEMEAAVEPRLGGERMVRRRLARLAEHRAGLAAGALDSGTAARLLGEAAAAAMFEPGGAVRPDELERMVERVEGL